jgi:hypothetical protein
LAKGVTAYSLTKTITAFTAASTPIDTVRTIPLEFRLAGYAQANGSLRCVPIALLMTRTVREIDRASTSASMARGSRPPPSRSVFARNSQSLDLNFFNREILRDYIAAIGNACIDVDHSHWVIDGSCSATASPPRQPHRSSTSSSARPSTSSAGGMSSACDPLSVFAFAIMK